MLKIFLLVLVICTFVIFVDARPKDAEELSEDSKGIWKTILPMVSITIQAITTTQQ